MVEMIERRTLAYVPADKEVWQGKAEEGEEYKLFMQVKVSSPRVDSYGTRVLSVPILAAGGEMVEPRFRDGRESTPLNYWHFYVWATDLQAAMEIGRWSAFTVDKATGDVWATIWFDNQIPLGQQRYGMHKRGTATDWSVEFMPGHRAAGDEANQVYKWVNKTYKWTIPLDGKPCYYGHEWMGLASCPHGAQPDATTAKAAAMKAEIVKEIQEAKSGISMEDIEDLKSRLSAVEAMLKKPDEPERVVRTPQDCLILKGENDDV